MLTIDCLLPQISTLPETCPACQAVPLGRIRGGVADSLVDKLSGLHDSFCLAPRLIRRSRSPTVISCLLSDHPALFPTSLRDAKSTLIVVSHPDDECLFFAPAILATVRRARNHGALLVMSAGNHYGLGGTRRKELKASCAELGIRDDRCEVMDISSVLLYLYRELQT